MPNSPTSSERSSLPSIAAAVVRALTPRAEREEVLSELTVEFRERVACDGSASARLWIWRQCAQSVPHLVRRSVWRGTTGFEPQSSRMNPGGPALEQWIMDGRHAFRRLTRRPRYALLSILTLALGIGGTSAVFGIARGVLFDPLPYKNAEGVALFWQQYSWTQKEFAFFRGAFPGFSSVAQYTDYDATLELGDAPAQLVPGISASSELFAVLGAQAAMGRTFNATDDVRGAAAVAVISHSLWVELGGDPSVLGRRIQLGGKPTTIVGVMPKGFWFPAPTTRVWIPEQLDPTEQNGKFTLVGRLASGNTIDRMAAPLAQLTAALGKNFQYTPQFDKSKNAWVKSVRESFVGPLRPTLYATFAAMAMILLIACANVAALMLGQVEGRSSELAVRSALGATQGRISMQLLSEALLLGGLAGAVGGVIAAISFRWLIAALALGEWGNNAVLDWRVFAIAMFAAIVCSVVISLAPTFSLWRGRLRDVIGSSRTGGVRGRGIRLESALVVVEVALAVLVTAGAGLLVRSVDKLYAINPGLETKGVGVLSVVLPSDLSDVRRAQVTGQLIDAVRVLPGVKNAATVQMLPLRASAWNAGIVVEGKPDLPGSTTLVRLVSDGYLETMGIALRQGRLLSAADMMYDFADSSGGVVVINESLAKKYFPGENPLGRRVNSGFSRKFARIVGVVGDAAEGELRGPMAPVRYAPLVEAPFVNSTQHIVFKVKGDLRPSALLASARAAVHATQPRVAIQEGTTMDQVLARSVGPARQLLTIVALLTALALFLGAIGIYGVMSHFVARRQRDWGIRIALGLRPVRVLSGVVGRGTRLVAVGVVCGLVAFVLLAHLMRSLVYEIQTTDPLAIGASIIVLLLVGVAAAMIPALRASRTDPAIVLREQ